MFAKLLLIITFILSCSPSFAQVGHPAKGSWSGEMVSSEQTQRLRLLIGARNGELSAVINPGRNSVDAISAELESETWMLTIVSDMPDGRLIMTGKLENLGSWTSRTYIGTYTLGDQVGEFEMTLN